MNPTLEKLIALQAIDTRLIRVRRALKAGPAEAAQSQAALDEILSAIADREQEIQQTQAAIDEADREGKGIDAEIERLREKMKIIKNNREYQVIKSGLTDANRRREESENAELESMERLEALKAELETLRKELQGRQEAHDKVAAEIAGEVAQLTQEVNAIKTERKAKAAEIDELELATYEDVIRNNKGIAIATVENGACQGCYCQLSPNMGIQVRRNDSLIRCGTCGRYLYHKETDELAHE